MLIFYCTLSMVSTQLLDNDIANSHNFNDFNDVLDMVEHMFSLFTNRPECPENDFENLVVCPQS